jgi:hypothetical protein
MARRPFLIIARSQRSRQRGPGQFRALADPGRALGPADGGLALGRREPRQQPDGGMAALVLDTDV